MKKLILLLAFLFLPGIVVGADLTTTSSQELTSYTKTVFLNGSTGVATDIISTVSKHVAALHDGKMNGIRFDTTLASGEDSRILIYGPDEGEGYVHILWDIDVGGTGQLNFYYAEPGDVTAGAAIPIGNFIAGETVDPETTAFIATSVASFGTQMHLGGNLSATKKQTSSFVAGEEVLLNDGLVLIVELCSLAAGNITTSRLWWHRTADGELP
jgi:hypothetical protein